MQPCSNQGGDHPTAERNCADPVIIHIRDQQPPRPRRVHRERRGEIELGGRRKAIPVKTGDSGAHHGGEHPRGSGQPAHPLVKRVCNVQHVTTWGEGDARGGKQLARHREAVSVPPTDAGARNNVEVAERVDQQHEVGAAVRNVHAARKRGHARGKHQPRVDSGPPKPPRPRRFVARQR